MSKNVITTKGTLRDTVGSHKATQLRHAYESMFTYMCVCIYKYRSLSPSLSLSLSRLYLSLSFSPSL